MILGTLQFVTVKLLKFMEQRHNTPAPHEICRIFWNSKFLF